MPGAATIFKLPSAKRKVGDALETIPSNWCAFEGSLIPSKELLTDGRVATRAHVTINAYKEATIPHDGMVALLAADYLPTSLVFAGGLRDGIGHCVTLAAKFLRCGYQGDLRAYSANLEPATGYTMAAERFLFSTRKSQIIVDWNEELGGRKERVAPLIKSLEDLQLEVLEREGRLQYYY